MGTLVANETNNNPIWGVNNLPPDTNLRLRIYSASRYAHSQPLVLYTQTKPRQGLQGECLNLWSYILKLSQDKVSKVSV